MTNKRLQFGIATFLGWLSVIVVGCVNLEAPPDPTRFYLLNGPSDLDPPGADALRSAPSVSLAPIQLEPYLDSRFMVLRLDEHEVQFSDIHRWGEELSHNIHRAFARHLLATGEVSSVVDDLSSKADYIIEVHIHRFEGVPPNIAHVSATWRLHDRNGNLLHMSGFDDRNEGWRFENYGHLAEKLDESLGVLAEAVAGRMKSL